MGQPKDEFAEYTPGPCWLGNPNGADPYTSISFEGERYKGHRVSYEVFYGPIPDGLVIHHLCNTKNCFNPMHMIVTTHSDNIKRGPLGKLSDACKRGHPWTEASTRIDEKGKRRCRLCDNARRRTPRETQTKPRRLDNVCKNGHLVAGDNAYFYNGFPYCKQCRADADQRRLAEYEAGQRKPKPQKTHCKRGHRLVGDNVRITRKGYATCIVCETLRRRERDGVMKPRY